MNWRALSSLILLTSSVPCTARLGETEAQVATRYGEPLQKFDLLSTNDATAYSTNRLWIAVYFTNGVSVAEMFVPQDRDDLRTDARDVLLEQQRQGSAWTEVQSEPMDLFQRWRRYDGRAFALYHTLNHSLLICTPQYWRWMQEKKERGHRQRFEGF